ncbi:MAG: type II toxin-antitoxin system VapC family toxin [Armatimonadetes bacterium]|nr:type II toxin-antitoxin system VapC family toxin [Armatimonadota bacterium]
MRADSASLLLLDTSVLVHLARDGATGRTIEAEYSLTARPERPLLSTVVEGEILGLARLWGWGEGKIGALQALLAQLVRVDAGLPEVVAAYANLYCEATRGGKPRGENDLWIAATAVAAGAALVTCDTDFVWLHPAPLTVYLLSDST